MSEGTTVRLDLAKTVFQGHSADAAGLAVLRKKLRRSQVLTVFQGVALLCRGGGGLRWAHFYGHEIGKQGHQVRLIPPA